MASVSRKTQSRAVTAADKCSLAGRPKAVTSVRSLTRKVGTTDRAPNWPCAISTAACAEGGHGRHSADVPCLSLFKHLLKGDKDEDEEDDEEDNEEEDEEDEEEDKEDKDEENDEEDDDCMDDDPPGRRRTWPARRRTPDRA